MSIILILIAHSNSIFLAINFVCELCTKIPFEDLPSISEVCENLGP